MTDGEEEKVAGEPRIFLRTVGNCELTLELIRNCLVSASGA